MIKIRKMKGDKLLIEKKCKELGFELVENDFDYDKNRDAIFKVRCLLDISIGHLKMVKGTSLVVQWLRIHLPMQGT